MDNSPISSSPSPSSIYSLIIIGWIITLLVTGFVGFYIGKGSQPNDSNLDKKAPDVAQVITTPPPTDSALSAVANVLGTTNNKMNNPPSVSKTVCNKTGFAQTWEYLTPYVVKQNDSNEVSQADACGIYPSSSFACPVSSFP